MEQAITKASALAEALPYIQRFHKKEVVVKIGGSIMDDELALSNILTDIVFMDYVGISKFDGPIFEAVVSGRASFGGRSALRSGPALVAWLRSNPSACLAGSATVSVRLAPTPVVRP